MIQTGRISIELLPDRFKPGALTLFDPRGKAIFACLCLGRSGGWTNPLGVFSRDPLKFRGNTPTGLYGITHVEHMERALLGIGRIWVGLDPIGGQALEAEKAGRRGLGIHGGRGDAALKATHGCVRLLDKDMAALARIAGKLRFDVYVSERAK